ncbi:MAG TPA: antitoxin [Vineibacter sp.]|nr:antitoxin [Vineibacter sp.]
MPHTAKLRRVGGSVMLAIPPALLDAVSLAAGRDVAVSVDRGRLVIEPRSRRRYTLDELLAQSRKRTRRSAADRAWLRAASIGRELL